MWAIFSLIYAKMVEVYHENSDAFDFCKILTISINISQITVSLKYFKEYNMTINYYLEIQIYQTCIEFNP